MTPSQQKAIDSNAQAILVVAGAGSGKTRVLVHRIARLIRDGCQPSSILVLTFTRKAARELKERLATLIGEKETRSIWAGTFHAISYRMLAKWGEKIGYQTTGGRHITIITPEEREILLENVAREYGWNGSAKDIDEAMSHLAHKGEMPDDLDLQRIIREYHAVLRECNALDFDQILLETHRLFRECPEALSYFRSKFVHVFVDEYQDTDTIQYRLHEVLDPANLFCVGDPRQAIYGWRGAEVEIILGFERDHPGAEVVDLLECFRCGEAILDAANNLIEHNPEGKNRLIPTCPEGSVEVRRGGPDAVAEFLSEDLATLPPASVAVLARTHGKLGEVLAFGSASYGLDLHKVGATINEVKASRTWKHFQAIVRLILNPRDNIAFETFGAGWLGLSMEQRKAVKGLSLSTGCARLEACRELGVGDLAGLDQIAALRELPIGRIFAEFYRISRPGETWLREEKFFNLENDPAVEQAPMLPADWLVWVQTADMHAELEAAAEKTQLLTAHASKGLEWDVVILAGFDRHAFPMKRCSESGQLEEERRLAYVAFTRAKKRLVIFTEKPSEFIQEAGL
jgi:DNA helicase-2/ATP-dependent DNA helicase PcrA